MSHRKQFDAQLKSIDAAQGKVTSVVAVFGNVDLQGDRILPGAFDRTIARWKSRMAQGSFLPVVWGHQDSAASVVGKVTDLRQTSEGLEVDEQMFMDKAAGRDAFDLMREGVLPGSSFAYDIIKAKSASEPINPRHRQDLMELDLLEVGPTIYPANPDTRLVGVKASVDSSAWDANRAMTMCSSAAEYGSICAAEHNVGQTDERQHWAGPHHYLGRGPNADGVRAALSRWGSDFGGTQVQNISQAEWSSGLSHLQSHMAQINPDAAKSESLDTGDGYVEVFTTALADAFEKAVDAKVGRELSAKNSALIRQMHDMAHQLLGMPDHAEGADKTEEPEEVKVEDPPMKAEVRAQIEALTSVA